jgi:TPR repeat protein
MAYKQGNGVARNNSLAKKYLKKAEALEFALAEMELKKMNGESLPDESIVEAEVKAEVKVE